MMSVPQLALALLLTLGYACSAHADRHSGIPWRRLDDASDTDDAAPLRLRWELLTPSEGAAGEGDGLTLTAAQRALLRDDVLPATAAFWRGALSVQHPATAPLRLAPWTPPQPSALTCN